MTNAERIAVYTAAAVAGYAAQARGQNPHFHSSPLSMAWSLGFWMHQMHLPQPAQVRPSVGYTWWANGGVFDVTDEATPLVVRPIPEPEGFAFGSPDQHAA